MINGQGDLDLLIAARIGAIPLIDSGTLPVMAGVPEEEVVEESLIPGLNIMYQYDFSLENQGRVRHQPRLYRRIDPNDPSAGVVRIRPPTFRRLVYELRLYTRAYGDMVELSRRLLSRLRREYDFLTDADGNEIVYRLDRMMDHSRRIKEERVFVRDFSFSFDAWVLEQVVDLGEIIRPVELITTDIKEFDSDDVIIQVRVPRDPE
jgi:hypothetical protein